MKLFVLKNYLGGQILYRNLALRKKYIKCITMDVLKYFMFEPTIPEKCEIFSDYIYFSLKAFYFRNPKMFTIIFLQLGNANVFTRSS